MWKVLVWLTAVLFALAGLVVVFAGLARDEVWIIAVGLFTGLCGLALLRGSRDV